MAKTESRLTEVLAELELKTCTNMEEMERLNKVNGLPTSFVQHLSKIVMKNAVHQLKTRIA